MAENKYDNELFVYNYIIPHHMSYIPEECK